MHIAAAVLLAVSGLVCLPVVLAGGRLRLVWVRILALLGTLLLSASAVLGLAHGDAAPAWLTAPAAILAAVGLGSALTVSVLSFTRIVRPGTVGASSPAIGAIQEAQPPEDAADPGAELLRGGALIGVFERAAITATLLAGWPEGLAVVLAVKGLGRFPELKGNQGASERFILGTLVSVLAAAACAGVGRLLTPA